MSDSPLRVHDDGSAPLVLLLHGFTASKDTNFLPALFDRLAKRYSVLAPDLYAHGEHPGRFEDLTFARLEEQIDGIIEERAHSRTIVLIGHSMGGALAYRIAARRSDVIGTVLLAPGFEVTSRFLLDLMERARRNGKVRFTDGFGNERIVSSGFFETRGFDPIALARLEPPSLVMVGSLDYTVSQDACERVADAMGARFERVDGVAHTFDDSDGLIGPRIESFIASLT